MAGSTLLKATGAGIISAGVHFLGQQIYNRGATFEKSSKTNEIEAAQSEYYTILKIVRTGVMGYITIEDSHSTCNL